MGSCHVLHFSPTGGVLGAATALARGMAGAMGCELEFRDLTRRQMMPPVFAAGDVALLAGPVFGGRMPALMGERLRGAVQTGGKPVPAAVLAVYGNRACEDALLELADWAGAGCGFHVLAGVTAPAEHSMCRSVAAGRPDAADEAQLEDFGRKIAARMRQPHAEVPGLPGNRPYRQWTPMPVTPVTTGVCIACGRCVMRCPTGAITSGKPEEIDPARCILCMRCVSICPVQARSLPEAARQAIARKLASVARVHRENELFL